MDEQLSDDQFNRKYAAVLYKTTYRAIGTTTPSIPIPRHYGVNGHFTNHLSESGMYRNCSLNTTADKERWVNGSKDWMEHLNS